MSVYTTDCRWAPQEPGPHLPSPARVPRFTRAPACPPARLLPCLPPTTVLRGARMGGRGRATGPWHPVVAQAEALSDPGTLAGCPRLGSTPTSASIPHLTAPHGTAPRSTAPHHPTAHHTKAQYTTPCPAALWEMGGSEQQRPPGQALGARRILSASSPSYGTPTWPFLPV